jgi:hypothetical protein
MSNNQKAILILMSLIVLCLCAFVMALIPSVSSTAPSLPPATLIPSPDMPPGAPAISTPLQHKKFMARLKCRRFIQDRLVSPSSAIFSSEKSYKVNDEPLNYHAVTGIVESQNRLGVPLRSKYRCDLHYLPDDPNVWILDYLDFED